MIVGIVGSRRKSSEKDRSKLYLYLSRIGDIDTIVTGDCYKGGDKFAREYAKQHSIFHLDVKFKRDPETDEILTPPFVRWGKHWKYNYYEFCVICYARNEEIAKEPLDYLIALVAPDRKGGTENTIKHFKKYHKDWKEKLIII